MRPVARIEPAVAVALGQLRPDDRARTCLHSRHLGDSKPDLFERKMSQRQLAGNSKFVHARNDGGCPLSRWRQAAIGARRIPFDQSLATSRSATAGISIDSSRPTNRCPRATRLVAAGDAGVMSPASPADLSLSGGQKSGRNRCPLPAAICRTPGLSKPVFKGIHARRTAR